jgi:7,8-dihydro-6-hydroxymethylpterin-pyrophosphokinase
VEREMGRPSKAPQLGNVSFGVKKEVDLEQRWESRIIDIDILFYGDQVINEPDLMIPHYGVVEREFELAGMCDLAPDFVHPLVKKTMKELLSGA